MAKSSVNFQKTKPNSVAETTRDFEAKYLLEKKYRQENSYWNCGKSDREIYDEQRKIYDEVKTGRGKRPSYENCVWEAVVNFNADHTLEDMKKVSEHIAKKFNIIPTRIAMHRDEGHLNSNGEVVYNYHAHLNFVTLKDAQQNWTVSKTKHKLSELQTEVAEILNMERGEFKSEAKRLDHKQYRAEAKAREKREQEKQELTQELKAEILSKKEIKEQFEAFRKENAGQGLAKEFFRELSDEKKKQLQEPSYTQDELKAYFNELLEKHTSKKKGIFSEKEVIDYEKIIQEQQQTISDLNTKNDNLKQIANKTIEFIDKKVEIDLNAKFDLLKQQNEKELKEKLKTEREKLEKAQIEAEQEKQKARENYQYFLKRTQEISQSQAVKEIETTKNKEIQSLKANNTELNQELANYKKIANDERELKRLYIKDLQEAKQENEKLETENKELKKYIERLKLLFNKAWTNLKPLKGKLRKLLSKPKDKEPKKYQRFYLASNGRAICEKYTEAEYQKLSERAKKDCSLIEPNPKKQKEIKRQGPTRDYF